MMMNIQEQLGIKYPILQGGMANIATGAFAAAVSNAGALGTIASGGLKPDRLEQEIEICKSQTDRPFAVNLMMLSHYLDDLVEVILKHRVPIVTAGAGSPAAYMERFNEQGIKVLPLVSSPTFAVRAERTGVFAIIAEGTEAGGHIGEMTTMTLIPQTVAEVSVPVIGAGGVGSGKQMLAAEILGASGVQMGTAFLFTEECPLHPKYKEALIKANSSKVTVIGHLGGLPIRLLKNNMTREYRKREKEGATLDELEMYTLGALRRAVHEGDTDDGSLMAGYTVGQFTDIVPVKTRLERIMEEYEAAKSSLVK